MMMIMRIAPHLWDFVVFKKSYYSDVNSLLCSETSREASPAKQQIYQVLYLFVFYLFLRGKLSNKYTIYDIWQQIWNISEDFPCRCLCKSRRELPFPSQIPKSSQAFKIQIFEIRNQELEVPRNLGPGVLSPPANRRTQVCRWFELLMRPLKMKVVFFTPILEAQTAVDLSPVHKADWHLTKILSRPPSLRTSTCTPVSRRGAWPRRCRARKRQNWNPCSTGGK